MRRLLALIALVTLTPSALARMPWSDKPAWSEVDGAPAATAAADTLGVTVLAVDKKSLSVPKEKITLAPGRHGLLLAGTRGSSDGTVAVSFRFDAAPCVRYRLAGRQASPGDASLQIVVVAQEPIDGCTAPAGTVVAAPVPAPRADPMAAPAPVIVQDPAPATSADAAINPLR